MKLNNGSYPIMVLDGSYEMILHLEKLFSITVIIPAIKHRSSGILIKRKR
jgi:hypothetical protein